MLQFYFQVLCWVWSELSGLFSQYILTVGSPVVGFEMDDLDVPPFAWYYLEEYQAICVEWLLHQILQEMLCFQSLSESTKD